MYKVTIHRHAVAAFRAAPTVENAINEIRARIEAMMERACDERRTSYESGRPGQGRLFESAARDARAELARVEAGDAEAIRLHRIVTLSA